jgi:hypothetical protein
MHSTARSGDPGFVCAAAAGLLIAAKARSARKNPVT